jgi:hypothetical protein
LVRYERQIGHRVTQGAGLFVIEDGKVLRTFSTVGNPHDGEAAALEAQAPKLIEDMQSGKISLPEASASCISERSDVWVQNGGRQTFVMRSSSSKELTVVRRRGAAQNSD